MNMEQQQHQNLIQPEYYNSTFLKIIKAMKCDMYLILNDKIIGTNKDQSYISVVDNLNNGIPFNEGRLIELSKEKIIDISNNSINENLYNILLKNTTVKGLLGYSEILNGYMRLINIIGNLYPSYIISNLKENNDFNNILKLKAADGAVPFKCGSEDTIFIYSGLLGINKSDLVSLHFYKTSNIYGLDIAEFIIDKKFIKIHKYIGYLPIK